MTVPLRDGLAQLLGQIAGALALEVLLLAALWVISRIIAGVAHRQPLPVAALLEPPSPVERCALGILGALTGCLALWLSALAAPLPATATTGQWVLAIGRWVVQVGLPYAYTALVMLYGAWAVFMGLVDVLRWTFDVAATPGAPKPRATRAQGARRARD